MKLRKIKYLTAKFFGWKEDAWARLGGRWGKKSSYGHFAGMADMRTRAELPDAAARAGARHLRRYPGGGTVRVPGSDPGASDATACSRGGARTRRLPTSYTSGNMIL